MAIHYNKSIVKVETSWYSDNRGLYTKIGIRYLRRHTNGNILEEDCNNSSAQDVIPKIINLNECEDGIYRVVICNKILDRETGYVDDYDYRLIPYEQCDSIKRSHKSIIDDIGCSLNNFVNNFTATEKSA